MEFAHNIWHYVNYWRPYIKNCLPYLKTPINNNGAQRQETYQLTLERIVQSADAEILLYRQEPSLPLQDAQGKFCCPLTWWRNHSTKYKMLSEVALRLLCIPATSAPSARVFFCCRAYHRKGSGKARPPNSQWVNIFTWCTSCYQELWAIKSLVMSCGLYCVLWGWGDQEQGFFAGCRRHHRLHQEQQPIFPSTLNRSSLKLVYFTLLLLINYN